MLRAKFGRIKIRTNLLQRFDNKFCYKIDKKINEFSNEIADCCSIRMATLPQKESKFLLKTATIFFKNSYKEIWFSD